MTEELDNTFYERADGHIHLANEQLKEIERGKVSASFMYGCTRFQAWNAACWAESVENMKANRQETVDYFVQQYRAMLEENLDDYIEHYANYMQRKE
ncbi:MAG TPA: DUF3144 domain-containing protein [Burkholderiales bacterium]|nr:DUF3144 domain-containing protein [Burkholderiales bacterium]